jgi:hypothetical protein
MPLYKLLQLTPDGNQQEVSVDANPFTEVISERYCGSAHYVIGGGMVDLAIDSHDASVFRAIQYQYTLANSDASGYETGQIFIVHDGTSAVINWLQGAMTGVPSSTSFSADISGGQVRLKVSTDNGGGGFSRILHLFTVALS